MPLIMDAPAPRSPPSTVILFDGLCNLCNESVKWVIARDRDARFNFASLQSEAARRLLADAGFHDPEKRANLPDSIVLMDENGLHMRSDAAIRIARGLGFPWSLATVFFAVPRPLRDWAYSVIARNRYGWFGRRDTCMVPTPELRARFLDADEPPANRVTLNPPPPPASLAPPFGPELTAEGSPRRCRTARR